MRKNKHSNRAKCKKIEQIELLIINYRVTNNLQVNSRKLNDFQWRYGMLFQIK